MEWPASYRIDVRVQEVATGRVMNAHTVTGEASNSKSTECSAVENCSLRRTG
jgi:hypothetical protein